MVDPYLQELLDDPIQTAVRANKLFLPAGKRPADTRTNEQRAADNARSRVAREANQKRLSDSREKLLDYYASTEVPIDRVVSHTGLKREDVIDGFRKRGRKS